MTLQGWHEAEHLRAMSCELGQGYLFAHPLSTEALETWLERGSLPTLGIPLACPA